VWSRREVRIAALLALSLSGCGGAGDHAGSVDIFDGTPAGTGSSAAKGGGGRSGSGLNPGDFESPTGPVSAGSGDTTGAPIGAACVGETQLGHEVEVDMYVMLDRSASMRELTGTGASKWDAIGAALTSFVQDPQSSGLGVGLQYFPIATPGVPDHCGLDSDCGAQGGQCRSRACAPPTSGSASFTITSCLSNADCPTASSGCVRLGVCSSDSRLACFDLGSGGCGPQGDCVPYVGDCTRYASCTLNDYATPAVPIALLPDNSARLIASLATLLPRGLTPTSPALSGALKLAGQQASAHPDHRVIAVLATDGLPTDCLPSGVQSSAQAVAAAAKVAQQGFTAQPSIPTYVIGVFAASDTNAHNNLNQLAVAGGTKQAFVVDQGQDVAQQLIDALSKIRTGWLACEYQLPSAPLEQSLDFTLVNVELNSTTRNQQTIPYVRSLSLCSHPKLGWYYDADPSAGESPTKISLCPKTCDTVHAEVDASIDIRLGCATLGPD